MSYSLQEFLEIRKALRKEAGLSDEGFTTEELVKMLSDEIRTLRHSGRADASIADLIRHASGRPFSADELSHREPTPHREKTPSPLGPDRPETTPQPRREEPSTTPSAPPEHKPEPSETPLQPEPAEEPVRTPDENPAPSAPPDIPSRQTPSEIPSSSPSEIPSTPSVSPSQSNPSVAPRIE